MFLLGGFELSRACGFVKGGGEVLNRACCRPFGGYIFPQCPMISLMLVLGCFGFWGSGLRVSLGSGRGWGGGVAGYRWSFGFRV